MTLFSNDISTLAELIGVAFILCIALAYMPETLFPLSALKSLSFEEIQELQSKRQKRHELKIRFLKFLICSAYLGLVVLVFLELELR